jgi:hypothetical protein
MPHADVPLLGVGKLDPLPAACHIAHVEGEGERWRPIIINLFEDGAGVDSQVGAGRVLLHGIDLVVMVVISGRGVVPT